MIKAIELKKKELKENFARIRSLEKKVSRNLKILKKPEGLTTWQVVELQTSIALDKAMIRTLNELCSIRF